MALLRQGDKLSRRESRPFSARAGCVLALASFLAITVLCSSASFAQAPNSGIIYTRQPVFRIPFDTDADARRLQEVQLYVSEDLGQSWQKAGSVRPEERGFNFRAERDGLYWFTVRTVAWDGKQNPASLQGAQPQLRVFVDTHAPIVNLRQAPAREGMMGVEWDIREDNLDLSTFSLEYRAPGSVEWIPLPVTPAATGQRYWTAGASGTADVRLRVRDLAKNENEANLTITPGGAYSRSSSNSADPEANRYTSRTAPATRWVNSKRISLNYKIEDKGPSDVSAVELWFTRDGQKWERLEEPKRDPQPPYVFDVHDEGLYGFTLVIRNGVGLGAPPPRTGDPPQVWVQVDTTKPIVHWAAAEVGQGPDTGKLTITWKATDDKGFGPEPIKLSYAEDEHGPWTPIVANIDNNTGKYVWNKGPGPPHKFWVQVEATDKAGNKGVALTPKAVLFDLSQPKGLILDIAPATREGPEPGTK